VTDEDFITELFCRVDDQMLDMPKHSQAKMYPSELVTLGMVFALKGSGSRAFYRWISRNFRALFPTLLERSRFFRALRKQSECLTRFMAAPSLIGLIDSFGIELIHPRREGRSEQQIGRKGLSNRRWIVGGKVCLLLNHVGLIVAWACDTANVYDGTAFQDLVDGVADEMLVFGDPHFVKKDWQPTNLKPCKRGEWNSRMLIETVLSMLTVVCHFKHLAHRVWDYFEMRLGFTMAMFNLLVQWDGLETDDDGFVRLSIANFSL
jgi:hypothetical protein